MIHALDGYVTAIDSTSALMEVGPVLFTVLIPAKDLHWLLIPGGLESERRWKLKRRVYTTLKIVNEMPVLYGFYSVSSRDLFVKLQGVSGVGARYAFLMLSDLGEKAVKQAIMDSDLDTLQTAKGVGYKTARRITDILGEKLKEE